MVIDSYADLEFALSLADLADRLTTDRFRAVDLAVSAKPDRTPVTEADQAVERAIAEHVRSHRPGDAMLGEEYGTFGDVTGRCWVVDPIDGTANYLRGVPVWATLIGLLEAGTPVLGVVTAPAMGRRWWADTRLAANNRAFTQDVDGRVRPLRTSHVRDLAHASLSYSDRLGWPEGGLDALAGAVWRTRAYGDFYSHVLVAEGAVDVAVEPALAVWDVAALVPLVQAAGGITTGTRGAEVIEWHDGRPAVQAGLVSSNGALHSATTAYLHG